MTADGWGRQQMTHLLQGLGRLLYLVDPADTSFADMESLPKPSLTLQVMPYFFGLFFIEWTILILQGRSHSLNYALNSLTHGAFSEVVRLLSSGALMSVYVYIHTHYRLCDLAWDSTFTWLVALLAVDFAYYWVHRALHEVSILWAAHQVHHTSEEFDMSVGVRHSALQALSVWPLYYPLALFIPPTQAIIHMQLNYIYQFWVHTEVVGTLGPLEEIFNTASYHRVHHGSNRYCIDVNYGGLLIIWDRLFGTLRKEKEEVKIIYGIALDQTRNFNPLHQQLFYYKIIWEKAMTQSTWLDFCTAFFKPPSFLINGTGDFSFLPEDGTETREIYNPPAPLLLHVYTIIHFLLSVVLLNSLAHSMQEMSEAGCLASILYLMWSLTSLGLLYDGSDWSWLGELVRCLMSLCMTQQLASTLHTVPSIGIQLLFTGSAVVSGGGLLLRRYSGKC